MGKEFENRQEGEVTATPHQVWEAIATGPGIDSWYLGRNEVEPGVGGAIRTDFVGIPDSKVRVWEPPRRLLHGSEEGEDGRFVAYEFLVEGTDRSTTIIRFVTSGFLPGDDWEDEYEAMGTGLELFFSTLLQAMSHFPGRRARPVTVFGPMVDDPTTTWARFQAAVGLAGPARPGDRVQIDGPGLTRLAGEVYAVNRDTVGIRTDSALFRFIAGFGGPFIAAHHLFDGDSDIDAAHRAWSTWLERTVGRESP